MFAIKVCSLNLPGDQETTYHAYAYTVASCSDGSKTITMALDHGVVPHPIDPKALNLSFTGIAFVMNETGKTIDTIRSNQVPDSQPVSPPPTV